MFWWIENSQKKGVAFGLQTALGLGHPVGCRPRLQTPSPSMVPASRYLRPRMSNTECGRGRGAGGGMSTTFSPVPIPPAGSSICALPSRNSQQAEKVGALGTENKEVNTKSNSTFAPPKSVKWPPLKVDGVENFQME